MIFYILSYLYFALFSVLILNLKINKYALFIGMLPAVLIVTLRGNVGTDTYTYLESIEMLKDGVVSFEIMEPGFVLLLNSLIYLGFSSRFIIALITFIISILLLFSMMRDKNHFLIFMFLLFPYFYFDMTMNCIRAGLSLSICIYSLKFFENGNIWKFIILSIIAISIHITSIAFIGVYYILNRFNIYNVIIIIMLIFAVVIIDYERVISKILLYQIFEKYSFLSGIAPLVIFLLIYFSYRFCFHFNNKQLRSMNILFLLEGFSFLLTQVSYSGLRFQNIFLLLSIVYISSCEINIHKYKQFIICLVIISVLSFSFKFKNFISESNTGESPFLPYHFIWDVKL